MKQKINNYKFKVVDLEKKLIAGSESYTHQIKNTQLSHEKEMNEL